MLPVVEAIARAFPEVPVGVDTRRSAVALAALDRGATITNDVSGGAHDPAMLGALADDPRQRGVVLMHMRGTPATMTGLASYDDVVAEVASELNARVDAAAAAGVAPWRVVVDPGLGFAKNTAHNVALLRALPELKTALGGLPLLVGPSRKRFLGELAGEADAARRDAATAGACCACAPAADVVRVHDVWTTKQALAVYDAVRRG